MEGLDASEHYEDQVASDQGPSLLTIILDTNPAAWALLSDSLPFSKAVADVLVFINAHLACQYTNDVAVIASHCDKAQFLYPTPTDQKPPRPNNAARDQDHDAVMTDVDDVDNNTNTIPEGNKYRPFRLIEEQVTRNLQSLLKSTSPETISTTSTTMIAGALTLALSYINRKTISHNEATTGGHPNLSDPSTTQAYTTEASSTGNALTNQLQARILLITLSPSTDLAHQYIPIMNSIFACQRLNIPIDVLQLPLPSSHNDATTTDSISSNSNSNSTVFLQQAADATHGIFIPARLSFQSSPPPYDSTSTSTSNSHPNPNPSTILTYLLSALLSSPGTRRNLILPTRIDVDFRAACFCHRNVISTGFVCSICLSIFCSVPENGECLTCGTSLKLGDYGGRPVVVPRKKKKKRARGEGGSAVGTPIPV